MTITNPTFDSPAAAELLSALHPPLIVAGSLDRNDALRASKILIVDDEPVNVVVARKYLNLQGYHNTLTTTESREVISLVNQEQPHLILLDIEMPHVSGLEILAALRADNRWTLLPVVILIASNDQSAKRMALELGANDFLSKPVDPTELIPRIQNVLTAQQHHLRVEKNSQELEAEVVKRTAELAQSRVEVIHCLARASEFRDDDTGRHVVRVGRYARLIAQELGWKGEDLDAIEQAAQLHDIGKIGVPDSVLLKPGRLTPEEYEVMQKHSGYGTRIMKNFPDHEAKILRGHAELGSRLLELAESPILALAATISLSHHEKWDGSGYPLGLADDDIPIEGRITAVADVFDALRSKRPYKPPFPMNECFQILKDGRGKHFDPEVLDAFLRRREDVIRTQIQYADAD